MNTLPLTALATLAVFTAGATTDRYQQLPGHFGGFESDSTIAVADDFELPQTTLISGLMWWGGDYNPPPVQDSFTMSIYADSGGQPGSPMAQFALGSVDKTATGQFVNAPDLYPEYEYAVSFSVPIQVMGGTKYWVSIVNSPANFWLWEASASSLNSGVQRSYLGGAWQPYYDNTAFRIVTVPEPDVSIITAAFGGIMLSVRIRKSVQSLCAEHRLHRTPGSRLG